MNELLTSAEMGTADRLSIQAGPFDGMDLMRRAGAAVASIILRRYPWAGEVDVLCGPGNNGGDGYVVAQLLHEAGTKVRVWALAPAQALDAKTAASECQLAVAELSGFMPGADSLVVDALFGAGLSRALNGEAAAAIRKCEEISPAVVSIDLPSGISGDSGKVMGASFRADLTVTFFRKKPGHLLYPGREMCGHVEVADIGIRTDVLDTIRPACSENVPQLWLGDFPRLAVDTYKYARGHVGVFSGGPSATGAARLSARAAARVGAGAVTLLSPGNAVLVNASHLTSIILRKADTIAETTQWLNERKPAALVFGPAAGLQDSVGDFLLELIGASTNRVRDLVLDADALTHISRRRVVFLEALKRPGAPRTVLTPHEGEFARVFPELARDETLSKLDRARRAAALSGATIILKGPDTVIASAEGRTAINANAAPWLATAGSGDVLSGITAGLLAQGMPAFEAACAAVWLHGAAGSHFGQGLIAEDLPDLLPQILRDVMSLPAAGY